MAHVFGELGETPLVHLGPAGIRKKIVVQHRRLIQPAHALEQSDAEAGAVLACGAMDHERGTVGVDDRLHHRSETCGAFGRSECRTARHLVVSLTIAEPLEELLSIGEHGSEIHRITHRRVDMPSPGRHSIYPIAADVEVGAEVDERADAELGEQPDVVVGGVAEMAGAKQDAGANPSPGRGLVAATVAEVDHAVKAQILRVTSLHVPKRSQTNAPAGNRRPTIVAVRADLPALSIGPIELASPVVLAPMAGVTDLPFRTLCREFGAGLYVNQMITARGLVEGHRRTLKLAEFGPDETPRSLQLYTTDAHFAAEAVKLLVGERGIDHIDLNFGCPAKKVTKNGGGAAVPFKRALYADIVGASVRAAGSVPVTVKFRVGLDDSTTTFLDAGRIAEDLGCVAVALHGRTARQHYSGAADWSKIADLKQHVTSIPVLGNGDIWEAADAIAMVEQTGCDGVVIGRGCLGRPWLFRDLADAFAGRPLQTPPTIGEIATTIRRHAELVVEWDGLGALRTFRKHAIWYVTGYPVGGRVRKALNLMESIDDVDRAFADLDPAMPMPEGAMRIPRSHTSGPHEVALPPGWLDDPDELTAVVAELTTVSGG